ncbi:MAG: hypothetical protein MZV63_01445 [Marinilabiliales bacterium]|nr:hypothetical protein [Marinilabiliales bacterium]
MLLLKSNLVSIEDEFVYIMTADGGEPVKLKNDLVYIFAGGELPTQFLEKARYQNHTEVWGNSFKTLNLAKHINPDIVGE